MGGASASNELAIASPNCSCFIFMGDSMGSQPQKTQGSPNFFLFIGFVELFMLIIFIKKFSPIARLFYEL
jgi:hypothetical protein